MRKSGPSDGAGGPACEPCEAPTTSAGNGLKGPPRPNDYTGNKRGIRHVQDAKPPSGGKTP